MRFLDISADFHHRRSLFTTSFHYIFTTFSPRFHHIYTTIYTTGYFYDIFSLHSHHKFSPQRDKQTGTNRLHGDAQTNFHHRFSPQMFTTNLHHRFSPQISLSRECDLRDKQTKINLETVASSNILIHSPGNSVERGCIKKFSPHVV